MRVDIGSRAYDLSLVPGPLNGPEGERTASVCDHPRRRILISATVPLEVRTEVAALAVSAAWQREVVQRPPLRFVGNVS